MRAIISILLVATIASVNSGFLPGGHLNPAPNLVATRTIVGGAVGGAPSAGAFSAAQYSQTVAVPAGVQTIISTQPASSYGFPGSSSNNQNSNSGSNSGVAYTPYGFSSGQNGNSGGQSGNAGGQNSGFSQSNVQPSPHHHQTHHNFY